MASHMVLKFESPSVGGDIDVLSWNQKSPGALTFTKYFDAGSTELMMLCWNGKPIAKATLRCYRSEGGGDAQFEYLVVTMQKVIIGNYAVNGGPGDVPTEDVTLEYGSISYEYRNSPMLGAKPATATFDVASGKAG